ncbi:nose resistant to fluoxetine protein 6-like [Ornithodoros turicata]|uniref:nose resistant to fluoxetine protein 6-like n=1 Tax=Ornithodoros turicata TaxID=34597 RepID=UPI003138DCED
MYRARCFLLLPLCLVTVSATDYVTTTVTSWDYQETTATTQMVDTTTHLDVESKVKKLMDRLIHESLPLMTALGTGGNVSGDCSASMLKLLIGIRKLEPWALSLVDANSRPPGGLISGSFNDLGTYDQCLSTKAKDGMGGVAFTGQYCTLYLKPRKLPFFEKIVQKLQNEIYNGMKVDFFKFMYNDMAHGLRLGVCFPSTCTAEEFSFLIDSLVNDHGMDTVVKGCVTPEKKPLTETEKGLLCFMAACISFLVVGSLTDLYLRKYAKKLGIDKNNLSTVYRIILSFSAFTNTAKLLNVKTAPNSDSRRLSFLHGMRFISATWVILGHSYLTIEPTAAGELLRVMRFGKQFLWCLVGNAYPSVQTFLFMSGFLLSYNIMKHLRNKKGSLVGPISLLLVRRYIRLTAPLMFVIGAWLLVPLIIDGPLAKEHHPSIFATCNRNWWRVLIQINNWSDLLDMCLQHSWYVSVDWQIYMVIWIIPVLMLKRPRLGFTLALLVILSTSTAVSVQAYINSYQPVSIYGQPELDKTLEMMKYIYYRPYVHMASYSIGIIVGYLVLNYNAAQIHRFIRMTLWAGATTLALLVVFGAFKWLRGDSWEGLDAAIYAGFSKAAWAVALSWVTFSCASGVGGHVNRLLSWKPLVPFSRLSYGAYLIHSPLYMVRTGIMRERMSLQHFNLVKDYFGCLAISYLLAYLLYLLCEAPVANLEKLCFAPSPSKQKPPALTNGSHQSPVTVAVTVSSTCPDVGKSRY